MVDAPYNTAFRGTRRVQLHRNGDTYDFIEDVGADGQGRIAVEVPSVSQVPPQLDPVLAPLYLVQRGLFGYRVRDPHITDLALFAANWRVDVLSRDVVVAGQHCWRLDLRRVVALAAVDLRFEFDVEPRTGFILAWREYDTTGVLFGDVAFQTFEFGGDVTGMNLRERDVVALDLDPQGDLSAQVNAPVRVPSLPPPGFELEEVEQVTAGPNEDWIKFVYSDGLERTLFAHRLDRTQSAPLPVISTLNHVPFGAWTFSFGEIERVRLVATGKVPARYLSELVQSAFR